MKNDLLKGHVGKTLLAFAFPFMLSNLLQVLYGSADMFVVGKYANTSAVSGVSTGSQVMTLTTYFVLGLTTGITVLLGQYFGAKKERELSKTIGAGIVLFGCIGSVLTIMMLLFNHQIVSLMNTPHEAIAATRSYIYICSMGIIFIVGYNVVSSILRGLGDSTTPLVFVFIACVINIIVDFVLVGYVHLGAAGAAIATVSAQGIAFLFSLIYLYKKGLGFPFYIKDICFSQHIMKVLKIGFPLGLQNALINISFLIITIIINKMGLVASAAVGVNEKLIEFFMLLQSAMQNAIATMVAQNRGARQNARAYESLKWGMFMCFSCAIVIVGLAQYMPTFFTSIFSHDPDVIYQSSLYLQTYSIDCLLTSLVFCFNGYFNGCQKTVFTMIHSLISTFIARIPITFLMSTLTGVTLWHMGIASPVSTFLSLIMCIFYLRKTKKELQ